MESPDDFIATMDTVNKKKWVDPKRNNRQKENYTNIIVEHFKYYLSVASVHGLSQIVRRGRYPVERLFWVCVILASLTFGLLKCCDIYEHYYWRPSVVSVELDNSNWTFDFLAITYCQKQLNIGSKVLKQLNISLDESVQDYLEDLAFSSYNDYNKLEKYANGSKREYLRPEEYLPVLLQIVPTGSSAMFRLNFETSISAMITEIGICSTINPLAGIYFTPKYFNSSIPVESTPLTYQYFTSNMKLETTDIQKDYEIMIHSPHEVVDVISRRFPGKYVEKTTITIDSTSVWTTNAVKALNAARRECKLNSDLDGLDHSPVYSYLICRMECRIRLCLKYCNCTPYYYRRNPEEKICNMTGMYCLSNYKDELLYLQSSKTNESICNCLQNCNDDFIIINNIKMEKFLFLTKLSIEVDQVPRTRYVRRLVYSKANLLVQLGGILGLCLGSSVIGIIEIIYFLTLRFYWCVVKGKSIRQSL